jgi:hypothetical protein
MAVVPGPASDTSDGYAIVLLGSFNPPIFHPEWFARHQLILPAEADAADDVDVDADWCFFRTPQFGCEVSRDRLHIFSTPLSERFEPLGQLAARTFSLLYHTPVGAVSMIRFKHVPPQTRKWVDIAPQLADEDRWRPILAEDPLLDRIVIRSTISGEFPGLLGFAAEPSRTLPGGIYLSVTHQYTLEEGPTTGAEAATSLLDERWEASIEKGEDVIDFALGL